MLLWGYVLMYLVSIIHWIDASSRARARGTGTVWVLSEYDLSVMIMSTLCDQHHRTGQALRKYKFPFLELKIFKKACKS